MKTYLFSLLLLLLGTRCFGTVAITTTSLPNGTVGAAYSSVVKASSGCTPYKWAIASGTLPAGVTANASSTTTSLNLTGTPTNAATYSFTVKVTACGGGTPATTAPHSSGSLLTTAPTNSPPAERPLIAIR